jgi:hypothetical protein
MLNWMGEAGEVIVWPFGMSASNPQAPRGLTCPADLLGQQAVYPRGNECEFERMCYSPGGITIRLEVISKTHSFEFDAQDSARLALK